MHRQTFKTLLVPVAFAIVFSACKKHNVNPSYTAKMGGVRNWRGYHQYDAGGVNFPTPVHEYYTFPDSSFALGIVDDSTVKYKGYDYKLQATDTALKIYFFGTALYYYQHHMGTGFMYYYEKDSIVGCSGDHHQTDNWWDLTELYYTY